MATLKDRFINSLLGVPIQTQSISPSVSYGENIDNYLNTLGEQSYMKPLLNQPKETGLTLDQYKEGVANGLNYGIPEIAKAQQELGINIPKTEEEIYKAQLGDFNQPTQLSVGTSNDLRRGGLIPDLISGFRENYTQGFDVNNLVPQNKGLATKIGEGLGTLARFYDRPIGRFAAAAGLSALTGGVNPMNEGITAYVGRQGNIARNKVYGEALKKMGYTDDQLAGINLSDDIFKNTMLSEYRNRLADYRNTKLDKDSFLKSQKQIMDYLDKGLITEDTAQKYLVLLNKKYQEDNPTDVQYGYKKEQGEEKLKQGERKLDIIESLGKGKLGVMQQNADTYAKNQGKTKIEDTDEYKQDYADYVKVMTGTNKKGRRYTKQEQEIFRDKFARKYGKLPKVN